MDLFLLSDILFYSRVPGVETFLFTPLSMQNLLNSLEMNSPPLSDLKHFNLLLVSFSTLAKYHLNFSNASDFSLKYIAIINKKNKDFFFSITFYSNRSMQISMHNFQNIFRLIVFTFKTSLSHLTNLTILA